MNKLLIILLVFFLLDFNSLFEIKNQWFKFIVYYGSLIFSLIALINTLFLSKTIVKFIVPVFCVLVILFLNPVRIIFKSSSWKTQKIIYKNGHLSFKNVEFQMRDKGALGYEKRIVEVIYITKLFMITNPVEKNIENKVEWIKVDEEINELGLK